MPKCGSLEQQAGAQRFHTVETCKAKVLLSQILPPEELSQLLHNCLNAIILHYHNYFCHNRYCVDKCYQTFSKIVEIADLQSP